MELNGNGHVRNGFGSGTTGQRRPRKQTVQAAWLQRLCFDAAVALRETCTQPDTGKLVMDCKTAVAVQKLVGAWDIAADRLRVLRGRGLPASVKARQATTTAQPEPLRTVP